MMIGPRVGTSGGVGTCALADLAVSKVRHDIATARIRNNAKVLPILPILSISVKKAIKAYS
jgi:hypothetical protein